MQEDPPRSELALAMPQGHTARRRFGQNFLSDRHYVARIVEALALQPADKLVEIGPGLGALTVPLSQRVDHLRVIEIDRDLAARLRASHPANRVEVIEADALDIDFTTFGPGLRIVGNLPYNISSPLVFRIAEAASTLRDVTIMLQKEVVERMAADPGSAAYGRMSAMLQWRFHVERLFDVPAGAFTPAPKVCSSIVRLSPKPLGDLEVRDPVLYARIVAAAFSQRRKTLRNALRDVVDAATLVAAGIDPGQRAEELGHTDFARLANLVEGD